MFLTIISNLDLRLLNLEPLQAIPAIPIIIGGAIIGMIFWAFWASDTNEVEGISLGVLGMKGAGKTQLYRTLQRKAYDNEQGTATDDYEEFTFKYGEKEIKIARGRDIGGGENYIRDYYEKMISEKDIIFFVFDASLYISESKYAEDVKARMDFIWRHMKEKYGSDEKIKSKLVTIGSHLDKIGQFKRRNLPTYFHEDVSGKPYNRMFHENFIMANLTDHEKLMKNLIDKKIFG